MNIIPRISKISGTVWRILGCNPGPMTLQGTNVYLVGTGKKRILIDAGQDGFPDYLSNISKLLKDENITVENIIITHWHKDHIGALEELYSILRPGGSQSESLPVFKFRRLEVEDDPLPSRYAQLQYLSDNQVIKTVGATIKAVYTPGHTTDHAALYLEEENSLFSGDCILGEGTAIFEDLHDLMKSLEKIKLLNPSVIYPGHGPVVDKPVEAITYYLNHRMEREIQIFAAIQESTTPLIPIEIVRKVYTETPEILYPAAEINVCHHLNKLLKDKKIRQKGDFYLATENGDSKL